MITNKLEAFPHDDLTRQFFEKINLREILITRIIMTYLFIDGGDAIHQTLCFRLVLSQHY